MPSCQFSLYPLGTDDLGTAIDKAAEELVQSGLPYEVGNMSTVFYGGAEEVFDTLKNIYNVLQDQPVVMTVTLSNACPVPKKKS
ncbi:MAG: hypothetical protein GX318_01465 [Clostridia bacterium]|mgnify:CR=1 FL=1|nr:hypothetical protein [Clostridia bacterium]